MITRLDHIQLTMPPGQEAAARKFFGALLEMEEEAKPPAYAVRGGCWFRSGTNVLVHASIEQGFSPQKKAHPAFCVRDLDALCARLSAQGFPIIPETTLPDRRRVYTTDPFGNRIELIQDGDGFGQR
ncbi:MAG TPA: VOC family protein [Opitutaceae bacterium]|nr:VOC family protein [Opitutaceae bacterium]